MSMSRQLPGLNYIALLVNFAGSLIGSGDGHTLCQHNFLCLKAIFLHFVMRQSNAMDVVVCLKITDLTTCPSDFNWSVGVHIHCLCEE